jgi:hypothetical protein
LKKTSIHREENYLPALLDSTYGPCLGLMSLKPPLQFAATPVELPSRLETTRIVHKMSRTVSNKVVFMDNGPTL